MSDDMRNTPEFREWEAEVQESLIPKIENSAATVSLVPRGETDVKFALELGLSIMLNKPILAVVHPTSKVPERLRRVADEIVVADLETAAGQKTVRAALQSFLDRYGD
jgi:hypothetical protein